MSAGKKKVEDVMQKSIHLIDGLARCRQLSS